MPMAQLIDEVKDYPIEDRVVFADAATIPAPPAAHFTSRPQQTNLRRH